MKLKVLLINDSKPQTISSDFAQSSREIAHSHRAKSQIERSASRNRRREIPCDAVQLNETFFFAQLADC